MEKKLLDLLNTQLRYELENALLYLSMASFFDYRSLKGFAHYFKIQAKEEIEHAMKIYEFINDRGERVRIGGLEKPKQDWGSVVEAIEDFYDAEVKTSTMIYRIDDMASQLNDKPVQHLMRWFIEEQIEEEKIASELLSKVKMLEASPHGIYMLDKELAQRK